MTIEHRIARTDAELAALYRFRYEVYVEELGRYRATADHVHRLLVDDDDSRSWNFYAWDGTRIVASNRITWGRSGFSPRQVHQYGLEPFLAELPADVLMVGERTMIAPELRGTDLANEFAHGLPMPIGPDQMLVAFGVCEPHLVPFYAELGQVPYASHNVTGDEAGYLVPIISFPAGVDALRGLGAAGDADLPRCVLRVLSGESAARTAAVVGGGAYRDEIEAFVPVLTDRCTGLFAGLTSDEVHACARRGTVLDCRPGDRVVQRGGSAHNVYAVLSGALEARDGDRTVGNLAPGDGFGEAAFLIGCPRTLDVVATGPATRVLSLGVRNLRSLSGACGPLAEKLRANLAEVLCRHAGL